MTGRPAGAPAMTHDGELDPKETAAWLLQRLVPDSGVGNAPFAFRTPVRLRGGPLRRALRALVARHPAFRTTFPADGGVPLRRVHDDLEPELVSWRSTATDPAAELTAFAARPIDVTVGPPVRVAHVVYPDADVVCFVPHHLVIDAVSARAVVADFVTCYVAFANTGAPPASLPALPPPAAGPVDAACAAAGVDYWRRHLSGAPDARLACARPEPAVPSFTGDAVEYRLSDEAVQAARAVRAACRATENIVFLAAFYLLLHRHGAGTDVTVGVPVDLREGADRRTVGYHMNTLPLRVAVDPAADFAGLVRAVRSVFLRALDHAEISYESVVNHGDARNTAWWLPPFRHMFNMLPEEKVPTGPLPLEAVDVGSGHSRVDLELIVAPEDGGVRLRAVYRTAVLDRDDVVALLARLDALLCGVGDDPGLPVSRLPLWCPRDLAVLARANATGQQHGVSTVLDAFLSRAAEHPDAPALEGEVPHPVTYRQLRDAAGVVAERLRAAGVTRGAIVALYAQRGLALAAAVLGTWLAGAAYLPLDPDLPPRRLRLLLENSAARHLLTDRPVPAPVPENCVVIGLDTAGTPADRTPVPPGPHERAYVIYTSGSTGEPKGVEVSHGNLANVVAHFADELDAAPGTGMLWLTTFAFDISGLEVFLPLSTGGRSVVAADECRRSGAALAGLLDRCRVEILQATPTTWRLVAADVADRLAGRRVLCGGEPLPPALAATLRGARCRLYNVYGPTETTIWSTCAEIQTGGPVTVGTPIANTGVFVVDPAGSPQPPGLPGEVCIAGTGVGLGYLGRPELTAQRFPTDPVHGRWYRTGDVGRWRHDGTLELLGREDRQVKLRGYRIELGEVEAILEQHPKVVAAAVTLLDASGIDGHLIAFVRGEDRPGLAEEVREYARDRLPAYAIPSAVLVRAEFPTTDNEKVDYRTLAEWAAQAATRPATGCAPEAPDEPTDLGQTLLGMWREMLGKPDLDAHADFFREGGNSLLAAQLVYRVSRLTGNRVGLGAVFAAPTPKALTAYLQRARGTGGAVTAQPARPAGTLRPA